MVAESAIDAAPDEHGDGDAVTEDGGRARLRTGSPARGMRGTGRRRECFGFLEERLHFSGSRS